MRKRTSAMCDVLGEHEHGNTSIHVNERCVIRRRGEERMRPGGCVGGDLQWTSTTSGWCLRAQTCRVVEMRSGLARSARVFPSRTGLQGHIVQCMISRSKRSPGCDRMEGGDGEKWMGEIYLLHACSAIPPVEGPFPFLAPFNVPIFAPARPPSPSPWEHSFTQPAQIPPDPETRARPRPPPPLFATQNRTISERSATMIGH